MLRASIAAETAGIPSVSIVCDGFDRQALATARGHGFDGMALAVLTGHVDTQTADEMVGHFVATTLPAVIAGLTFDAGDGSDGDAVGDEPAALDVVVSGSIDDVQDVFLARGWTDGHPVVPPTVRHVEAFLADSGHDPWKILGTAPSSGRDVTVWSIAVNAVMAGCRAEHLPVLLALAEILLDPDYGAQHSGNTTGADALIVLDGPNSGALGFHHGAGAMREGAHANTAVGRWLRLYLRNVFGFTADEHDKATFGGPARPVLAEDMDCLAEIGWTPVSARFGHGPGDDVVTMARLNSTVIVGSVFGATPDDIVPYLADGLVRATSWELTHLHGLGHDQFRPLLVLSPMLARLFARAGWTNDDVCAALFRHARLPAARFERYVGEWSNLAAGRPRLADLVAAGVLPEVFGGDDPDRLVPIVTGPDRIVLAVAGAPTRANAVAFGNDGPHGDWTARRIDHAPAGDLVCRVPPRADGGSRPA